MTTERVLLADYTTLHLGGPAARFVAAASEDELVAAVRAADLAAEPVLVLGGGSNLVVADDGFPGTVMLAAFGGFEVSGACSGPAGPLVGVTVAAGQDWDALVQHCVSEGLSGIECLSGIPGLAGATPIQNVGAYGQEVAQTIVSVRAYDRLRGEVVELAGADCGFGYRTSMFKREAASGLRSATGQRAALDPARATGRFVVLTVTFELTASTLSAPVRYGELGRSLGVTEGDRVPLADARAAVLALRRGKGMVLDGSDPDTRSAGSFFTNPVLTAAQFADLEAVVAARQERAGVPRFPAEAGLLKVPAAWLIEQAGFTKGYALSRSAGAARISAKHTLALTNPGGSSTAELVRLARHIRDGVRAAFGVELTAEPTLVGVEL
ncbi:MAG: UDP-N-acetylmuramate dehydrogenase [Streptosporangiaceae bacterium]